LQTAKAIAGRFSNEALDLRIRILLRNYILHSFGPRR
jgi:hypothetical protein